MTPYEDGLAQVVARANADAAMEKVLAVEADVRKMIAMRRKLFPGAFTEEQDERTAKGLVRHVGSLQHLLQPLRLMGSLLDQRPPITRQLTQLTLRAVGDEVSASAGPRRRQAARTPESDGGLSAGAPRDLPTTRAKGGSAGHPECDDGDAVQCPPLEPGPGAGGLLAIERGASLRAAGAATGLAGSWSSDDQGNNERQPGVGRGAGINRCI